MAGGETNVQQIINNGLRVWLARGDQFDPTSAAWPTIDAEPDSSVWKSIGVLRDALTYRRGADDGTEITANHDQDPNITLPGKPSGSVEFTVVQMNQTNLEYLLASTPQALAAANKEGSIVQFDIGESSDLPQYVMYARGDSPFSPGLNCDIRIPCVEMAAETEMAFQSGEPTTPTATFTIKKHPDIRYLSRMRLENQLPLAWSGAVSSAAKDYTYGTDEASVQLPAALNGIGEITYTLAPLPAGFTFDDTNNQINFDGDGGQNPGSGNTRDYDLIHTAKDERDRLLSRTITITVTGAA